MGSIQVHTESKTQSILLEKARPFDSTSRTAPTTHRETVIRAAALDRVNVYAPLLENDLDRQASNSNRMMLLLQIIGFGTGR
jgi:hypothetical protein